MIARHAHALGFIATLALTGCSASTDPDTSTPAAESDLKASSLAKEGDACGGGMAHPKTCAEGLTCVFPTDGAIGGSGTCEKDDTSGEGEACGGGMAHPKTCAEGLTCTFAHGGAIGGSGTCEKP